MLTAQRNLPACPVVRPSVTFQLLWQQSSYRSKSHVSSLLEVALRPPPPGCTNRCEGIGESMVKGKQPTRFRTVNRTKELRKFEHKLFPSPYRTSKLLNSKRNEQETLSRKYVMIMIQYHLSARRYTDGAITGLPTDARPEDVSKHFEGYGKIVDCRVMTGTLNSHLSEYGILLTWVFRLWLCRVRGLSSAAILIQPAVAEPHLFDFRLGR